MCAYFRLAADFRFLVPFFLEPADFFLEPAFFLGAAFLRLGLPPSIPAMVMLSYTIKLKNKNTLKRELTLEIWNIPCCTALNRA